MTRASRLFTGFLSSLFLTGCFVVVPVPIKVASSAPPAAPGAVSGPYATPINRYRSQAGLPAVSRNPALTRAAEAHAADMATRGFMAHVGSNGTGPKERARASGYRPCLIAENIAVGQAGTDAVLAWWMNSPPHRSNMLHPRASEFGMARAPGNNWVLLFGRPGC